MGVQSTVAPESIKTQGPFSPGSTVAMPGRDNPSSILHFKNAAPTAAPVFPALKTPPARPAFTMSMATTIELRGFSRMAFTGCSSIPTDCGASTSSRRGSEGSTFRSTSPRATSSRGPARRYP